MSDETREVLRQRRLAFWNGSNEVIRFVPKAVIEREAMIREARANYERIFPATPYVAPDSDPA